MIQLQAMRNTPGARRPKMRVGCGRGSGKGRTCGRGHKGQYARSGHKHKPAFEGGQMRLLRRIPKRGFNHSAKTLYALVPIAALERFEAGAEVTPARLQAAGLADGGARVKILGDGDLTRRLTVRAHAFSQSARRKIEAAGGVCEIVAKTPAKAVPASPR